MSALNDVDATFDAKYTAESFSIAHAAAASRDRRTRSPSCLNWGTTISTATRLPSVSSSGMSSTSASEWITTKVRAVEMPRMTTKRMAMASIRSSPRNRKSNKNSVRNTGRKDSSASRGRARSMGSAAVRMTSTASAAPDSHSRASSTSPMIFSCAALSCRARTMSLVAESTKPKSTRI